MKRFMINQLVSVLLATGCLAGFMIAATFRTSDSTAQCILVVLPAISGSILGWSIGFQGLTLSVYASAGMFILGQFGINPYYSSDVGAIMPPMLYSCFMAPAAVIGTFVFSAIRHIRKRKIQTEPSPAGDSQPAQRRSRTPEE